MTSPPQRARRPVRHPRGGRSRRADAVRGLDHRRPGRPPRAPRAPTGRRGRGRRAAPGRARPERAQTATRRSRWPELVGGSAPGRRPGPRRGSGRSTRSSTSSSSSSTTRTSAGRGRAGSRASCPATARQARSGPALRRAAGCSSGRRRTGVVLLAPDHGRCAAHGPTGRAPSSSGARPASCSCRLRPRSGPQRRARRARRRHVAALAGHAPPALRLSRRRAPARSASADGEPVGPQGVLDLADRSARRSGRRSPPAPRRRRPRPPARSRSTAPAPPLAIDRHATRRAHRRISSRSNPSLRAVGVHRVEQDLARAELGRPRAPLDRVDAGAACGRRAWSPRSRRSARPSSPRRRRTSTDSTSTCDAEPVGDLGDQLGPGDRGGVDPDLVGARRAAAGRRRRPCAPRRRRSAG